MKKVFLYIVLVAIISCGSVEEKKIVLESTNSTEESANDGVLENIYYSIPSPIGNNHSDTTRWIEIFW